MSSLDLRVQYGSDTVTILEFDGGDKYEVAHWTEDELENPDVEEAVEEAKQLVEDGEEEELIERLYGSVSAWKRKRENRKW